MNKMISKRKATTYILTLTVVALIALIIGMSWSEFYGYEMCLLDNAELLKTHN